MRGEVQRPIWTGFKTIQCIKRKGISPSIYLPKWWLETVEKDKPLAYMEVYPDRIIIYHPNHLPQKALQELFNLETKG